MVSDRLRTPARTLLQRPAAVLLVAEDDTLQHGSRDPNHHWDRLVELAALVRVACFGTVGLRGPYDPIQLFEGRRRFFLRQLHTTNHDHALPSVVLEPELELSFDLGDARDLGVVHKSLAARRTRRRLAGGPKFQALDDLRCVSVSGRRCRVPGLWRVASTACGPYAIAATREDGSLPLSAVRGDRVVRTAPKSKKKPPTTSSDGDDV